jgi:phosphohistidine phosphatase
MFMKLFLVQHAESKHKEQDTTRPLSEKGWKTIKKMAKHAEEQLQIGVTQICHSGKLRARQTAEVLAEYLNPPKGMIADENLQPLADPKIWKERLVETTKEIMLVGHLPHLSKLTSLLLVGDEYKEVVAFTMAGIACLERDQQRHWSIQWVLTPKAVP